MDEKISTGVMFLKTAEEIWDTLKQRLSNSSVEAEYRAMAHRTCEMMVAEIPCVGTQI